MTASDPEPPGEAAAAPGSWRGRGLAASMLAVAAGAALVLAIPELRHSVSLALHGSFDGLRSYIRGLGVGGLALLLALMLAHAVVWYPTEIVTATSGYVFGFLPGLAFVTAGWLVSALLSYLLGRVIGRPLLLKLLGPRFDRMEHSIERGGALLLVAGRLIPIVPFSLMGYAAGAARVRVWRFGWTSVIGFLPLTAAVAYLGSRAKTFSAGDPILWVAGLVLVGLFVAARVVAVRRRSAGDGQDAGSTGELEASTPRGQAEPAENDLPARGKQ